MSETTGTEGSTTTTGTTGTETTTTGATSSATFTQADLDRIVGERLAKQKAQFKDYDDLKTKATQYDELTEAQKTELQKAQDKATAAEQKTGALTDRLIRAEVKAIASGEFQDPADAYAFLGDLDKYLDKNGEPDAAAIEEALKEVLKAKPYLAASTTRTDVGLGARGGAGSAPGMNDLLRQAAGRR